MRKEKKPRCDKGTKRVKKVIKIMWWEEGRWYKVGKQWIQVDDNNVSICSLYLLSIVVGSCMSTF